MANGGILLSRRASIASLVTQVGSRGVDMSVQGLHFLPHGNWISGSRWKLWGIALCIGLTVFAATGAADWLLFDAGVGPMHIMLASDGLAAFLAAAFAFKLMVEVHRRRDQLRQQLDVIGETNHHIRNALELIQFSAQSTHNEEVISQISSAVDRIQWVLRDLSGERGEESRLLKLRREGRETSKR